MQTNRQALQSYLTNPPQKLLLVGPAGIGKTTLARQVISQQLGTEITGKDTPDFVEVNASFNANLNKLYMKVKYYLIDEVHLLKNQEILLDFLDSLPADSKVICCTTSTSLISKSLQRRLTNIYVPYLSDSEEIRMIKNSIQIKQLSFTIPEDMFITLVRTYTKGVVGFVTNLFDGFEVGKEIGVEELELFIDVKLLDKCLVILQSIDETPLFVVDKLYNIKWTEELQSLLVEVYKLILGGSSIVPPDKFKKFIKSQKHIKYLEKCLCSRDYLKIYLENKDISVESKSVSKIKELEVMTSFTNQQVELDMNTEHDNLLAKISSSLKEFT